MTSRPGKDELDKRLPGHAVSTVADTPVTQPSITNATSFDELELQQIVDPDMLSPRIPYPPGAIRLPDKVPALALRNDRLESVAKPNLHVRSRSLGSILAPWPSSPPRSPLPPVPPARATDCEETRSEAQRHPFAAERAVGPLFNVPTPKQHIYPETGTSPGSFISVSSTTDSHGSDLSADGDAFYTAPVSPASFTFSSKPMHVSEYGTRVGQLRQHGHTRQSSSTSTIRTPPVNPFFQRENAEEISTFSDSDEESDVLATPTDPLPARSKHKRTGSFFKIIDRLKYGADTRR
ncbi:hypothetical protein P389DRAFT_167331 [Cystobasidium minutum MCA 4210]|uniref:uncharacterized protein n=1 Tax=Cystobasidium minutum MCA 4210 TaxID=1397322 RepID=UPI0034CDCC5E|eukprot:jgi/Rhomi1/167331/fgenesh1_kg.2_\